MRIENLRKEKKDGLIQVVATVIWENSIQGTKDVYFATREEFSDYSTINPDAFLVGCCLPAMHAGEERIKVEGTVCPELMGGVALNMQTFRKWYGRRFKPVAIEASVPSVFPISSLPRKTGLFFSGGLDSIYSLRVNRLNYPLNHPESISECFIVHGFDIHSDERSDEMLQIFDRAVQSAREVIHDAQANLIPIFTNIRHMYNKGYFWPHWFHGAALASVAHCLISCVSKIHIASSHDVKNLEPWGSHPEIDPHYSSSKLKIVHDDLCRRFEKIQKICDWEPGFQNIRTCYQNDALYLNCGRCRNCIKTMIMLIALGKLEQTKAFPVKDLSGSQLQEVLWHQSEADFQANFERLIPYLEAQGRRDLSEVIHENCSFRSRAGRLDRKYLKGSLTKLFTLSKTKLLHA